MRTRIPALCALAVCALGSTGAHAASANSSATQGTAQAAIVVPLKIIPGTSLRFGQFAAATTSGTLTIDPSGAVSTTGGMVGANTFTQTGTGRGNATFSVTGNPNAAFGVTVSTNVQLANGANRMPLTGFTGNVINSAAALNATGNFTLNVGATLNVAANQAVGTYSGTYVLTVVYQ